MSIDETSAAIVARAADVQQSSLSRVGVVVIGRNEGERLRCCLQSMPGVPSSTAARPTIVYVDSGSSDASVELARSMQVEVVELDLSRPFTAGRARNEGFAHLRRIGAKVE